MFDFVVQCMAMVFLLIMAIAFVGVAVFMMLLAVAMVYEIAELLCRCGYFLSIKSKRDVEAYLAEKAALTV